MEPQFGTNKTNSEKPSVDGRVSKVVNVVENTSDESINILKQISFSRLNDLIAKLAAPTGKKSFLVLKNNKYINVLTENIAFFCVNCESSAIICFDKQEYFLNYTLDHLEDLLPAKLFFRLNRQYLINFNAVKEVEHYLARKLLVNTFIPVKEKLLVPREKVTEFLHWLDDR